MSAYQCSAEHIAFICSVYSEVYNNRRTDYMTFVQRSALFDILTKANAESVAFRYREPVASCPRAVAFPKIDIATIDANIGAIFKSIACLEYQSCEPDGWKDSNAFGLLQGLRDALLSRLLGADRSDAWGLPDLRPVVCAEVVAHCYPITKPTGSRCAAEIVCNPDDPQLPVCAKGREDCRHIGGDRALAVPAICV